MGRKLRVMTVEKGLLRETKMVQRLTDALLECKVCGFCPPLRLKLRWSGSSTMTISRTNSM